MTNRLKFGDEKAIRLVHLSSVLMDAKTKLDTQEDGCECSCSGCQNHCERAVDLWKCPHCRKASTSQFRYVDDEIEKCINCGGKVADYDLFSELARLKTELGQ